MRRRAVKNFDWLSQFNYFVPGGVQIVALFAWFLVGVIIGNVASLLLMAITGPEIGAEYSTLLGYPFMFLPPMIYASIKSRGNSCFQAGVKIDNRNFAPKGGALCALVASLSTLALSFCSDLFTSLLPPIPDSLRMMLESLTNGNLWVNLICVSIFAPLCEEWLCRGMVLRGLLSRGSRPSVAIVISALVFAVIHMNPWQAVPAFLMGCLFGYFYYRTGSLKLTMLMHCVNNTSAVILSRIPSIGSAESMREVIAGPRYWLIFAACILLVCLCIRFVSKVELEDKARGGFSPVPSMFE